MVLEFFGSLGKSPWSAASLWGKGRVVAPAAGKAFEGKGKKMVAAPEKVGQQVSPVALLVRDGQVDDDRPFMPHASAGAAPLGLD